MEDGDIQQCFQLLKKKTILNFYSNYLECFRCQPAVLTILADPGDRRPEESLPAFVARQLAAKRSQAARLEETIRRYFTVFPPSRGYRQIRYLGERCLSLAIARDLQRAFLREARELVDETSRRTSRRRSDEETIPRGFASPRGPVRTISQSASPAVPSVVLSPYGNSLLPMMNGVYSYPMVGSFLESSKPPVCELPPSFQSLPLLVDNPQVNAMFGKMELPLTPPSSTSSSPTPCSGWRLLPRCDDSPARVGSDGRCGAREKRTRRWRRCRRASSRCMRCFPARRGGSG